MNELNRNEFDKLWDGNTYILKGEQDKHFSPVDRTSERYVEDFMGTLSGGPIVEEVYTARERSYFSHAHHNIGNLLMLDCGSEGLTARSSDCGFCTPAEHVGSQDVLHRPKNSNSENAVVLFFQFGDEYEIASETSGTTTTYFFVENGERIKNSPELQINWGGRTGYNAKFVLPGKKKKQTEKLDLSLAPEQLERKIKQYIENGPKDKRKASRRAQAVDFDLLAEEEGEYDYYAEDF